MFAQTDELLTLRDWLRWAVSRFAEAGLFFGHGTDNARDEAAWLVARALAIPFDELDTNAGRLLTETAAADLRSLVEARINTRKPLAYLLNEAWFAGLRFYVDERVLIPRSLIGDFLPDQLQPYLEPARVRRILDLCTGSGCIAIAAAHYFPEALVDAADISTDAVAVAGRNVEDHRLGDRVELPVDG